MDGIAGDILKEGELKSVVIFSSCFSSEVFIVQTLAIKLLHSSNSGYKVASWRENVAKGERSEGELGGKGSKKFDKRKRGGEKKTSGLRRRSEEENDLTGANIYPQKSITISESWLRSEDLTGTIDNL